MAENNVQDPRAIIENIDSRLALLHHTLHRTRPEHVDEDIIAGLIQVVSDIQIDVNQIIQFCEIMGDEYMEGLSPESC